jgi:hypothetical protein
MKNPLVTLLVITITGCFAYGQTSITPSVINSTGGTFTFDHFILDWSIGELSLVNQMGEWQESKFIISNGFLQPFTQDPNLVNNTNAFAEGEILILPNPTQNILEVDFRTKQQGFVSYRLYDVQGRTILKNSFNYYGYGYIEKIDMTGFSAATYFLRIELNPDQSFIRKVGSFKIIKL